MTTQRTVTIGANLRYPVFLIGRVFAIKETDAPVNVRIMGGSAVLLDTGDKIGTAASQIFAYAELHNPTGSSVDVTFIVSTEDIQLPFQATVTNTVTNVVKDFETYVVTTSAPTNAATTFNGTNAGNRRKQIVIFNAEAIGGANITVKEASGAAPMPIIPQEKFTLVTNGEVIVTVGSGVAAAFVLETFYDEV